MTTGSLSQGGQIDSTHQAYEAGSRRHAAELFWGAGGDWGEPFLLWLFYSVFLWDRGCTQSFVLAKQALYLLSHTSSSFFPAYFGDGVSRTIWLAGLKQRSSQSQVSEVDGITGVSHWHWAQLNIFDQSLFYFITFL
jgi:hypothetical protein